MINCCTHIVNQFETEVFTEEEQDEYVQMVWLGLITKTNLSRVYNFRVTTLLQSAITDGYGVVLSELTPGTLDYVLLESFQDNINTFVPAKQYSQVATMEQFIAPSVDFNDFKKVADSIFNEYNKNWLRTEFDTTVNATQSGRAWIDFEKQKLDLPFLTYQTQQDGRVRPEHTMLQGITKRVDDPFWNSYTPPNGWNCRCFLTSSSDAKVTPNGDIPFDTIDGEVPDLFKFNPGKTGFVFNPNMHPYFDAVRTTRRVPLMV